jgi:hypothetical protein
VARGFCDAPALGRQLGYARVSTTGQLLDQQRIPPPWTATRPFVAGLRNGRNGAGRWKARTASVGRWRSGWSATAEQVVDVPAKLAARVRVLSVGHGRKSDPADAVSVAVAARNVPSLRPVGVQHQATVLHLLTKRREDLVAARTQSINPAAPGCWSTWSRAAPDATSPPTAPRCCWPGSHPPERRRCSARSWPPSLWPTAATWSSRSQM